jgi:DNA polymerase III subunit delta
MVNQAPSVFVFAGDNDHLKENALKKLKSFISNNHAEDIEFKTFYGDECAIGDIFDYAASMPLFSSKKLAMVRNFDDMKKEDAARMIDYAKSPGRSTYLVIDTRERSVAEKFRSCGPNVRVTRFDNLKDGEIAGWIKKEVSSYGKNIDDGAADILKELQGGDMALLAREVEKLVTFTGDRKDVASKDAQEIVGKSISASAFDIGWAIGEGDIDAALRIAADLISSGKRPHEILGIISWHMMRLLKAKALIARGMDQGSIIAALKVYGAGQGRFFKQLSGFSSKSIKSKIGILLEADLDIKRTRLDPALVLELAVIRLCLG